MDKDEILNWQPEEGFTPAKAELGMGTVHLAKLTAAERNEMFRTWTKAGPNKQNIGAEIHCIAFCLCDEQNNRYFNNGDLAKGVAAVGRWTQQDVVNVFEVLANHNGLTSKKSTLAPSDEDSGV